MSQAVLIEVPSRGGRRSSIDQALVDSLADLVGQGWATDQQLYDSRGAAAYSGRKYRVAVAEKLDIKADDLDGRVFEDRELKGKFRFAFTLGNTNASNSSRSSSRSRSRAK